LWLPGITGRSTSLESWKYDNQPVKGASANIVEADNAGAASETFSDTCKGAKVARFGENSINTAAQCRKENIEN
jgi:hypothetical protein